MNFNGYNPYMPQYMQHQSMQNNQTIIQVTGREGANAYQLAPNSAVALFDSGNNIFYLKTTDGAGFPTIKEFEFKERSIAHKIENDYVTRKEFEELTNQLKGMIENGKQPIPVSE
jgi:hypothetical protein